MASFGGMTADTSYTDRGKADFDVAMQLLNPYGTWSKIEGAWAYTPLDHEAPYTDGRWIYTEYGWYWKGRLPHSWLTEHYGYWKRGADKVWSWYPGPFWLPEIVEIRATSTHIGWRSAAVDREGSFVEGPADRYTKTDEWTFVSMAQFANPITPEVIAKPDVTKKLLENSTECRHIYVTYREIDRPGPHPADFLALCRDGGMFAPKTLQDELAPLASASAGAAPGSGTPSPSAAAQPKSPAPKAKEKGDPQLAGEMRKVKYWITMSLPTYWTPPPPDAKAEEIYLYRPDFYQDEDGIARRIQYWLDPSSRKGGNLLEMLTGGKPVEKTDTDTNAAPATPAMPAVAAKPKSATPRDPFKNSLDESFHSGALPGAAASTPSPPPNTNALDGPIPPPVTTNAAPAGGR